MRRPLEATRALHGQRQRVDVMLTYCRDDRADHRVEAEKIQTAGVVVP
ncbi:hypothetical protein [Rhodococcus sp. C3V]|nr:hypothetical protein [Rhodococcus sp. C3V]MDF3320012.1 hypothetical protein [Rhodococcus sp. C3V]